MHYAVYLDEFGHIGPWISSSDKKYNDRPVFGFAGMLLPVEQVREFAIGFYQLKCRLLAWDLAHKNPAKLPPYQWEKKGSQIFTTHNINNYRELRTATNRLLNRIGNSDGHVFYTGIHKTLSPENHDSTEIFKQQLLQAIRKIDQFCAATNATFMVLLDEQQAGDEWRMRHVEACTLAMFEDKVQKCRTLIEPPLQGESHLFQTLQCADWLCGLLGRISAHTVAAAQYPDWNVFGQYFADRLSKVMLPGSGLSNLVP